MANYLQLHKFHSKQSVRIISSFKTFDLFVLFPIIEFERNGKLVITNTEGTEENGNSCVILSCVLFGSFDTHVQRGHFSVCVFSLLIKY